MIKIGDASNLQQKPQSAASRHKQIECNICLRKMRSDHLKRHMLKHQELHTLDEEEIRDEIKRRKKLRETREEREQLVRQIADEEFDTSTAIVIHLLRKKVHYQSKKNY